MRLHVRAPPASRLEETQRYFAEVETAIRQIVGQDQIDVILDNIGLPYSGINIALSDSATVGPMDGEILISLKEKHTPTPAHVAALRRDLPKRFPGSAVLLPARRYRQSGAEFRPAGADRRQDFRTKERRDLCARAEDCARAQLPFPASWIRMCSRFPTLPRLTIDVDRTLAQQVGVSEDEIAKNVLVTANSSAQTVPNFWIDPKKQRELSAGGPDADLSGELDAGSGHCADQRGRRQVDPDADECRPVRAQERSAGGLAAQHPAGFRRQRRRSGPRPRLRRGRNRQGAGSRNASTPTRPLR